MSNSFTVVPQTRRSEVETTRFHQCPSFLMLVTLCLVCRRPHEPDAKIHAQIRAKINAGEFGRECVFLAFSPNNTLTGLSSREEQTQVRRTHRTRSPRNRSFSCVHVWNCTLKHEQNTVNAHVHGAAVSASSETTTSPTPPPPPPPDTFLHCARVRSCQRDGAQERNNTRRVPHSTNITNTQKANTGAPHAPNTLATQRHIHTYIHTCTQVHTYTRAHQHTCAQTHRHTCTRAHARAYAHTHIHTHAHAHTLDKIHPNNAVLRTWHGNKTKQT